MSHSTKETVSLWMKTENMPTSGKLLKDVNTEVCVVGGGISGMTTAYLLQQAGKQVVLLEEGEVGSGETSRTTAQLSNAIDARYYEIERIHGEVASKLTAESHTAAIDKIEQICAAEKIDCGFKRLDGYLFAPDGESWEILDKELQAAHRAGLSNVKMHAETPILWLTNGACLKFPGQGQMDPLKYLKGISEAFLKMGGKIYTGARVMEIEGEMPVQISTKAGFLVTATDVVVATNTPINDRFVIHTKQTAYRTYVTGYEIPVGTIPTALYWDTLDPYHYIRLDRDMYREYLIVGGEDHRTGQSRNETDCIMQLDNWTRERFPQAGEMKFRWSGQIEETVDGLAYIGRNPQDSSHVYIATGDSGMGMTHGTIAGMLITDLILEKANPWTTLYDPSRKPILAMKEWLKENGNTALQFSDYFKSGEVDSIEDIPQGSGAIVRDGLRRIAAYRDEQGTAHTFSAVCPHLGGNVRWNSQEKTWDCPCHGSRFSATGEVINGPAISDLHEVSESDRLEPMKESVVRMGGI